MPADLKFRDTDNTTVLASLSLTPGVPLGSSYSQRTGSWKKLHLANTGDVAFATLNLDILQSGSDPAYTYVYIAPDASGAPNTGAAKQYGQGGLNFGALAVGASAAFWLDLVVPSNATATTHNFRLFATTTV